MRFTRQDCANLLKQAKDDEELKQMLQAAFRDPKNIDTFSEFFFPHVVTNKIPKFHKEVYNFLFDKDNGALAAPRGHAKSSITGIIFMIHSIVYSREKYIVYISQNHTKTVQFLTPIRDEFETNTLLRFVYGDLTPKMGTDKYGKNREDRFDVNAIRVEAVSFEKNLRGFKYKNTRPTLIVGDDIEDDTRVLNPELRIKDSNKLNKVIIPALDINGRFKFIGTILNQDSLLYKKIRLYKGKIFKACDVDFKNLLWPDRFTEKILRKIHHDIGSIPFQQEYLNNPLDTTKSLIKREWIEASYRSDLSHEDVMDLTYTQKTMGADFAFSDRVTADESAFVALGKRGEFNYLLLSRKEKGLSVLEQMNIIKNEIHPAFKCDQYGLEENSIKAISKDIGQWNLPITLFWTAAADPSKKKSDPKDYDYTEKRHTVGKINLIMRLGTAFENKTMIIPYKTEKDKEVAHRILSECTSYALVNGKLVEAGIHPDIPIGLGYALELMTLNKVFFDFGKKT